MPRRSIANATGSDLLEFSVEELEAHNAALTGERQKINERQLAVHEAMEIKLWLAAVEKSEAAFLAGATPPPAQVVGPVGIPSEEVVNGV